MVLLNLWFLIFLKESIKLEAMTSSNSEENGAEKQAPSEEQKSKVI